MKIPHNHPCLAGHFPGHPIVPGVVLLDAVLVTLAEQAGGVVRVTGLPSVKFLAPLQPDQEFETTLRFRQPGQAQFDVTAAGARLATGSLTFEKA